MTFIDSDNQSVLVIGATGLTGIAILQELSNHPSKPEIHVMARDPTKLLDINVNIKSVSEGDARSSVDIENALSASNADWLVLSVGLGNNLSKTDIRTANAKAAAHVLKKPNFRHVRTMVMSSSGAGSSKVIVGFGIGKFIEFHLRNVFHDHTGQERAFQGLEKRTIIARPTSLTSGAPVGDLVTFGDKEKSPTIHTDRADLAEWMVAKICNNSSGCVVNLTGVKK